MLWTENSETAAYIYIISTRSYVAQKRRLGDGDGLAWYFPCCCLLSKTQKLEAAHARWRYHDGDHPPRRGWPHLHQKRQQRVWFLQSWIESSGWIYLIVSFFSSMTYRMFMIMIMAGAVSNVTGRGNDKTDLPAHDGRLLWLHRLHLHLAHVGFPCGSECGWRKIHRVGRQVGR